MSIFFTSFGRHRSRAEKSIVFPPSGGPATSHQNLASLGLPCRMANAQCCMNWTMLYLSEKFLLTIISSCPYFSSSFHIWLNSLIESMKRSTTYVEDI